MEHYSGSLKGHLLMAMPSLTDSNFSHTVVCICEHTAAGAVGVVVNRVHESLYAREIFKELKIEFIPKAGNLPIHIGGPVHLDEIFILHGPPFGWTHSLMVTPSLALSNSMDVLQALAEGRGPESVILALGCAGWGPSQLEYELSVNAWLTHPVFNEIFFDIPIEARWEEAIRKIGINPLLLSNAAGHA